MLKTDVRGIALPPPRLEDLVNVSRVAAIAPPRPAADWPRPITISIAPARDAQGRATYELFQQPLPPRLMQLALRFTF